MKFFMLYLAKYKKRVSNLRRGKMPLFTVLSFRTPKSVENLKIIWINSWKSAQCMFYIRPLSLRRTTEGDYSTPFGVSEQRHAMRLGKWRHPGKVTCRSGCCWSKRDCFLVCFVQNIRYLVGTSDITTISNDRVNILQISCKTSLKKTEYHCVVQMHGLEHTQRFWRFRSDAVVFRLFKVFSSSLQHMQCTYRANIRDQLIENTTTMSVDVILSV